jgi:DNA invertase Pin-like site-specific DNA recombinase
VKAIGYIRVSTGKQGEDGNGMHVQRSAIEIACAQREWELIDVETDVASGKTTNGRHGLRSAIERIEAGKAEALVVTKLDRLARSSLDFATTLRRARDNGWSIVILELSLDTSTPMGAFTAQVIAAVAELEREMISARTKDALAVVRSKGVRLGRPRETADETVRLAAGYREAGMTLQGIAARLNADGVPTATGRPWTFSAVRRALSYADRIEAPDPVGVATA